MTIHQARIIMQVPAAARCGRSPARHPASQATRPGHPAIPPGDPGASPSALGRLGAPPVARCCSGGLALSGAWVLLRWPGALGRLGGPPVARRSRVGVNGVPIFAATPGRRTDRLVGFVQRVHTAEATDGGTLGVDVEVGRRSHALDRPGLRGGQDGYPDHADAEGVHRAPRIARQGGRGSAVWVSSRSARRPERPSRGWPSSGVGRVGVSEHLAGRRPRTAPDVALGEHHGHGRPSGVRHVALGEHLAGQCRRTAPDVALGEHLAGRCLREARSVRPRRHGEQRGDEMARSVRSRRHGQQRNAPRPRSVRPRRHGEQRRDEEGVLFGHGDTASSGVTRRAFCSATATRRAAGRPRVVSFRWRRPRGLARRSAPASVISTKTVGIVYDLATSVPAPEEESVECPAPSRAMRQPTSRPPG
jgi:hypothetical protein